jgi:putative spermidine/putrescine transport system permease protein
VLIGLVQLFLPITILILVPAVTSIHEEMDEAAQSLGAHWVRALWTVVLPMARPGLVNAFVIVLTLVFSDFAVPAILGGGRADFITNVIQRTYVDAGDRGVGGALCVAVTAVTLAIIGVFFVARSLSAGKGSTQHA